MSNNNDDDNTNDENNGKLKIVFAEGCFDNFDGTQEELDELIASLQEMVEDGSFFEQATAISVEDMISDIMANSGDDGEAILGQILAEALKESSEDFAIDPEVMDLSRMIPPTNTRH